MWDTAREYFFTDKAKKIYTFRKVSCVQVWQTKAKKHLDQTNSETELNSGGKGETKRPRPRKRECMETAKIGPDLRLEKERSPREVG